MTNNTPVFLTGTVLCDNCGAKHDAEFSHYGRHGEGALYEAECPVDFLTDYYTAKRVTPTPVKSPVMCASYFVVGYARRSCVLTLGHEGQHDYLTPGERALWNNTPVPLYRENSVPCRNSCGRKTWNTDSLCDPCRTAPNCD